MAIRLISRDREEGMSTGSDHAPRCRHTVRFLAVFVLCGIVVQGAAAETGESAPLLITDTTIIDGTGRPARHGVDLLINGGRIEAIGDRLQAPPGAERVDGTGKFVVPGLIDVHVHLDFPIVFQLTPEEKKQVVDHTPKAFLYNGVTTVLNLSSNPDWIWPRREAQRSGSLIAPRIFAMGRAFTPENGWGSRHGGALADAAAARRQALEYVAADTDGFKIVIEDGLGRSGTYREMPDDILDAIVDVARTEDVPLFVHAINLSEYQRAVEIDPRAIVHGLEDVNPPDSQLFERIVSRKITVVPTVSLFESFLHPDPRAGRDLDDPVLRATVPGFLLERMRDVEFMQVERQRFVDASARMDAYGWAESRVPVFRENVRKMHHAGVRIAVGTDAGGTVGYNFQGYNTPWEMKILVECGMSPMEALVAATRTGAEVIGVADRLGTVEPGKVADLLILSANPLENIENIRRIEKIIQDGDVHERAEFAYHDG